MNIQDVFKGIITKPHSLVVVALAFTDAAPRFFNIVDVYNFLVKVIIPLHFITAI